MSTRAHNEALLDALRALAGAGVPFATIGSAALALRATHLREAYRLPDADVLLPPGPAGALPFARACRAAGFSVTSWGAPWREGDDPAVLAGRWYLRATRGALQLDGTYECVVLDAARVVAAAEWLGGVPVAAAEATWALKLSKDAVAARAFAARWALQLPARFASTPAP